MVSEQSEDNTNPFNLTDNEKFVCYALRIPFVNVDLPEQIDTHLSVFGKLGSWICDHWSSWLGSLQLESIHESNCCIIAHTKSKQPEILDDEYLRLRLLADELFSGLLINDVLPISNPIELRGSYVNGKTSIRQYGQNLAYRKCKEHPYSIFNAKVLQSATAIRDGLRYLDKNTDKFLRFKRGIRSVYTALQSGPVDERTFYFVRSLETLHGGTKGEGRSDFVSKCVKITGNSSHYEELFGDLYDTRNNYVHANEFDRLYKHGENHESVEARLEREAIDVQLLVLEIYRTILSSRSTLSCYKDDVSSRSSWTNFWTPPITVETIRAKRNDYLSEWHRAR